MECEIDLCQESSSTDCVISLYLFMGTKVYLELAKGEANSNPEKAPFELKAFLNFNYEVLVFPRRMPHYPDYFFGQLRGNTYDMPDTNLRLNEVGRRLQPGLWKLTSR